MMATAVKGHPSAPGPMEENIRKTSQMREVLHRLFKDKAATIGMLIFGILVLIAVLAPLVAPYDYAEADLLNPFQLPSAEHWFGTDNLGRDILSRVIWGARYSLGLGLCAQLFALVFGVTLGCIAGYFGGRTDTLIMRVCDVWQSIPSMLMCVIISSALGTGWLNTVFAMGLNNIAGNCRMIRAQFLTVREQEFVEAERAINCPRFLLIFKHMLPNAISPLIVQTTMGIGNTIMMAAGLSYLGLGVQPPILEWGAMISDARAQLRYYPHLVIFPGVVLAITVLAINLFGDGLRDALDPKLKN